MVKNFFKNDNEQQRKEEFQKKWKEYIERMENRDFDISTDRGDNNGR